MFQSLRSRLLLSHVAVVLTAIGMAAVALALLLRGYQIQLAHDRLSDLAVPLALQARDIARQGGSPAEIASFLREQADSLHIRVLLVNPQDRIIADSGGALDLRGQLLALPEPRPVNRLQPVRTVFQPPRGERYLVVALPAGPYLRGSSPEIAWMVLAEPVSILPSPLQELGPRLLVAGGISIAAAALLALALVRWIDRPLQRLLAATDALAAGQYQARVTVAGPRELVALADGFNRMAAEVARSQSLLRSFLADVSHELRTPLTAIRGFAQAVLDGTLADESGRRRALEVIDQETRRLQRLVAELLELSRLQARQIRLDLRPLAIADVLHHCVEVFGPRAEEQLITLTVDAPAHLIVAGDFDRLEQVFSNLLDNALRHTPAGGQVHVTAALVDHAVEAAVADSGPGILPEDLPRVFERFRRGAGGGLGLGLAIVREIVEAHQGTIRVESPPDGGAVFIVRLPAVTVGTTDRASRGNARTGVVART